MKDSYYFSHDSNARNDDKILELRAEYGWEGYGIYWMLVEMMFESEETALQFKRIKAIAMTNNVNADKLKTIISFCIEQGLLNRDDDCFWSETLRRRKEKYLHVKQVRAVSGSIGGTNRWKSNATSIDSNCQENVKQMPSEPLAKNKQNVAKESKEKESKEMCAHVVAYLNQKTGASFKETTPNTIKLINARAAEGYKIADFKTVIDDRYNEWSKKPEMVQYLRPETLFSPKFEGYLNNARRGQVKNGKDEIKFRN